jgi:tetratricopeptide (TPR) repeat protein
MHYAHQKGLVHRDLKPGNVLLHIPDQPAMHADSRAAVQALQSAIPKITDFGLAKHLDSHSDLTRTGAVLGTPSYMAPEQAAGQSQAIGPATDVYALGAILYDALTGRPPFRGSTVLETLEQVRYVEPVPPRRLQPDVPRDLETICLTALAKEPSRRYPSALALAQDLELFCAGEPIRTRREGPLAKLYRKARRRPLLCVSVVLLLVAGAIAGYVGPRAYRDRQVAVTVEEIEDRLQTPELTEEYLGQVEARIGDLEEHLPDRAAAARRRLYQRFADQIREKFRDRLSADEAAPLQQAVGWLASRDAELAAALGKEVSQRLTEWQTVLAVVAPFVNGDRAFLAGDKKVQIGPDNLSLRRTPGSNTDFYVSTQETYAGNLKVTAVLAPSWESAVQVGVAFDPGKGHSYTFLLTMPESFARLGEPFPLQPIRATFADARKLGKPVTLAILRSESAAPRHAWLVREAISAAELFANGAQDGTLRLSVRCEGERLLFQVNQHVVEFRDVFPIPATQPVRVTLYWPPAVALKSLHAERRSSPAIASDLESGDELYQRGDYEGARTAYEKARRQSKDDPVRQEARYKEGVCLVVQGRLDQAQAVFEELSSQPGGAADLLKGPCWPVLADCQSLLLYRRQNNPDGRAAASAVLDRLIATRRGRRAGEFSAVVPFEDWESVIDAHPLQGGQALLRKPADLLADCERSNKAATLFEPGENARLYLRLELAKLFYMAGSQDDALRTSYETVRDYQRFLEDDAYAGSWAYETLCWLLRRTGERNQGALQAAKELDAWFLTANGDVRRDAAGPVYFPLVERARIHAALEKWDEAERDLDRFFALQAAQARRSYHFHAAACLLQGFLRERKGDKEGALAAWRRGQVQSWAKQNPGDPAAQPLALPVNITLIHHTIMASLTGELSDQDAADVVTRLLTAGSANAGGPFATLIRMVKFPPATIRAMWQTERGRTWARKIAYHDLSYAEYLYTPPRLMVAEYLHHSALPGPLSPAHDELIWKLTVDSHVAYQNGTLTTLNLLAVSTAWKGGADPLGFGKKALDAAAFKEQPHLRGPLAYLLGHRVLPGRRAEAVRYLTMASETLAADAPWRSLAEAELNRLNAKAPQKPPP